MKKKGLSSVSLTLFNHGVTLESDFHYNDILIANGSRNPVSRRYVVSPALRSLPFEFKFGIFKVLYDL